MIPYPITWRLITATSLFSALALFTFHPHATSAFAKTPPTATPISTTTSTYRNDLFDFSLPYPSAFTVKEYDEGEGSRTIVIQKGNDPIGLDMFITPDDEISISTTSLAEDFPTLLISHPEITTVGTGTPAIAFRSYWPNLGPSRELWFLH